MKARSLFRDIFWNINTTCLKLFLVPSYHIVVDPASQPLPRGPFIMVSNHGTFLDPWIALFDTKKPVAIMMNEEGFKGKAMTRWYLNAIGAFPKKKGAADFKAMKTTLHLLSKGAAVLIFPEAQVTWDGESQPIHAGVEKIVRKAKVPLVINRIRGNFLTNPWWAKERRSGTVFMSRIVFSTEQLAAMSDDEIRTAIIVHTKHNDLKDSQLAAIRFSGENVAEGLEHLLWKCRSCGADDHLDPEGSELRCTACGAVWAVDPNLRFTPHNGHAVSIGDLHDYIAWHKQAVKDAIVAAADTDILAESAEAVKINTDDNGDYQPIATGRLSLTRTALCFEPSDNATEAFCIPVAEISGYTFQRQKIFECHQGSNRHQFLFETKSPMKWVFWFRYLNTYAECEQKGYYIS